MSLILGLDVPLLTNATSLVDDITHSAAVNSGQSMTATAILGPFWRSDTPIRANGTTITFDTPTDGEVAWMYGKITSAETGEPVKNASVDVWQASTNGTSITKIPRAMHAI